MIDYRMHSGIFATTLRNNQSSGMCRTDAVRKPVSKRPTRAPLPMRPTRRPVELITLNQSSWPHQYPSTVFHSKSDQMFEFGATATHSTVRIAFDYSTVAFCRFAVSPLSATKSEKLSDNGMSTKNGMSTEMSTQMSVCPRLSINLI
jgi:hypothetical protein